MRCRRTKLIDLHPRPHANLRRSRRPVFARTYCWTVTLTNIIARGWKDPKSNACVVAKPECDPAVTLRTAVSLRAERWRLIDAAQTENADRGGDAHLPANDHVERRAAALSQTELLYSRSSNLPESLTKLRRVSAPTQVRNLGKPGRRRERPIRTVTGSSPRAIWFRGNWRPRLGEPRDQIELPDSLIAVSMWQSIVASSTRLISPLLVEVAIARSDQGRKGGRTRRREIHRSCPVSTAEKERVTAGCELATLQQ